MKTPYFSNRSFDILIVDDERQNRDVLEAMLHPEGYILRTAASGEDALALVAREPPDLILLDVMMPGMSGFEVAAQLRDGASTQNIPVIMITALNDREARLRGLDSGAEDFLTKPVDRVELSVRVKNLLRLKAYGDYYDQCSRILEDEVDSRTAELVERTKALERQTLALQERTALLDLTQDAIIVHDLYGRVVLWNRGAEVMYGWSAAEAVGHSIYSLLGVETAVASTEIEATVVSTGHWEGEAVRERRDGTQVSVESRLALQRAADGSPFRILVTDTDISERKNARAEVLLLTERDRIRDEQLKFKDDFLSHVSHELRSPLTAIKQFSTILAGGLAGELSADQHEYIDIVVKNVHQLQSIIDDLIEVTRLETGTLSLNPEPIALPEVIEDAVKTMQLTARAKEIALSLEVSPDLPSVRADRTRLRQILTILLDNAIKFTPPGGAAVVRARLQPRDPSSIVVEVADTGCGIAPERRHRIFERLYQVPERLQSSRTGLGLGLYICDDLVRRHGSRISVESERDKGSIFYFTLPVASLAQVISPFLKNNQWPAESVALAAVHRVDSGVSPPGKSQEQWLRQARQLLQHCLLLDFEFMVPTAADVEADVLFVAAFTDAKGAALLETRIRNQFERHARSSPGALTASVSCTMLSLAGTGTPTADLLPRLVRDIEGAIHSQFSLETVNAR